MAVSERTPVFVNLTPLSVTPPDVPAVNAAFKTSTRAAPEINDPVAGLSEANVTANPVEGTTTGVVPGVVGVPAANELT